MSIECVNLVWLFKDNQVGQLLHSAIVNFKMFTVLFKQNEPGT